MRREGYELMSGKPEIVTKRIDGKLMEPVGNTSPSMSRRIRRRGQEHVARARAKSANMHNHGYGRVPSSSACPAAD